MRPSESALRKTLVGLENRHFGDAEHAVLEAALRGLQRRRGRDPDAADDRQEFIQSLIEDPSSLDELLLAPDGELIAHLGAMFSRFLFARMRASTQLGQLRKALDKVVQHEWFTCSGKVVSFSPSDDPIFLVDVGVAEWPLSLWKTSGGPSFDHRELRLATATALRENGGSLTRGQLAHAIGAHYGMTYTVSPEPEALVDPSEGPEDAVRRSIDSETIASGMRQILTHAERALLADVLNGRTLEQIAERIGGGTASAHRAREKLYAKLRSFLSHRFLVPSRPTEYLVLLHLIRDSLLAFPQGREAER